MTPSSWPCLVVTVPGALQWLRAIGARASVRRGFVLTGVLLPIVFAASSVAQSPSPTMEASAGSEQPGASEDSEATLPGVPGELPGNLPGAGGREVEVLRLMELYEATKRDRSVSRERRQARLEQLADRAWRDHLRHAPPPEAPEAAEAAELPEAAPSDFTALPLAWQLAGEVAWNLDETRRAQLRERYLGIVGQRLESLSRWNGEDVERLSMVLSELRSEPTDRAEIVASWINAGGPLSDTGSDTLRRLYSRLRPPRAGSPGVVAEARQRVVEEVERRLDRAARGERSDEADLFNLTGGVIASLPEERRDPLRDRLMQGFVEDRQRLGGLSLRAVIELNLVLFTGQSRDPFPDEALLARWVRSTDSWEALNPSDLSILALHLGRNDLGPVPAEVNKALAGHAWERYYADEAGWAAHLATEDYFVLLEMISGDLGPRQRDRITKLLRGRFLTDAAAAESLPVNDFKRLHGRLERMGANRELLEEAVARWQGARRAWSAYPTRELIDMLRMIGDPLALVVQADARDISEAIASRLLASGDPAMAIADSTDLALIAGHTTPATLAEMRNRVIASLEDLLPPVDSADVTQTIARAGQFDKLLEMLGADEDERAALNLLARQFNAVDIWFPYELARYQESVDTRYRQLRVAYWPYLSSARQQEREPGFFEGLREGLRDGSLEPRPNTLYLLSWYYRNQWHYHDRDDAPDAWKAYLDERIAGYEPGSKKRLQYLLGRAYAEELTDYEPAPQRGRYWIDQAFAEAESEQVRLGLAQIMFFQAMGVMRYAEAESLLDGLEPRFESEAAAERFAQLRELIEPMRAADAGQVAKERRAIEQERSRGRLASLERRLKRFQEEGRSRADIESVQKLLEQERADLAGAGEQ